MYAINPFEYYLCLISYILDLDLSLQQHVLYKTFLWHIQYKIDNLNSLFKVTIVEKELKMYMDLLDVHMHFTKYE